MGCDLVKISASGPMPTSRYCDQAPWATRCSLSRSAAARARLDRPQVGADHGLDPLRGCRRPGRDRPCTCSSTTRSSMLRAKVTPAALSACRSTGASSQGCAGSRRSQRLLARIGASVADAARLGGRARATGSAALHSSLMVGTSGVRSNTPSARIATTAGPGGIARQPDPADQGAGAAVRRQGRCNAQIVVHGRWLLLSVRRKR